MTTIDTGDGRTVALVEMSGSQTHGTAVRIAAEMDSAVRAVVGFWGAQWSSDSQHEITIDVTATEAQFTAALADTGAEASFDDVAAVAVAGWVDPAQGIAEDQRIVFAPGAYQMTPSALRLVLRHELFHYAARAQTALDAPVWITEGVADFVARPSAAPDAGVTADLPTDAEFSGPEPGRTRAYDRAWWFMRFVADTYGTPALRQFYLRTAGAGHTDVAAAVREVFHVDTPELVALWGRWQKGSA